MFFVCVFVFKVFLRFFSVTPFFLMFLSPFLLFTWYVSGRDIPSLLHLGEGFALTERLTYSDHIGE